MDITDSKLFSAASGGTGEKLGRAAVIVCGVAALVASLLSFLSMWLQSKNYRKPLLQRYVIRILLMVPIYSASSWGSIMSLKAAFYLDPVRDIYEAFTIYTFTQLLINFLGGERSLIIMMHGRQPVNHPWPLSTCFPKVDISDPHTFLAIKRGILQYAWLKPILSFATIIMKSTDTYQEGRLDGGSGYLWIGILYNLSVTLSLYSLAMFWVCMSEDLKPFRPVPKFLCIKLIIFASYWQGFFLSILQWLGAIQDVPGYSADNLAAAIQDALICCEMPIFAVGHWYAFSWHDYADVTISAARMPVKFALRDAFGIVDLIQDTKETLQGDHYEYRVFDSGDNVIAHEESESRVARMKAGMRYARGGKGKYWLPEPGHATSRTPLLGPESSEHADPSHAAPVNGNISDPRGYNTTERDGLDAEDENLFDSARALEFGDWNYPVITAHVPSSERWLGSDPAIMTTSTNRNLLQPTRGNHAKREGEVKDFVAKHRASSSSGRNSQSRPRTQAPLKKSLLREQSSASSSSHKSGDDGLVDLVVEDTKAEETERVRARKEGGAAWNTAETKHFIRTYDDEDQGDVDRTGFEPGTGTGPSESTFAVGDDEDDDDDEDSKKPSNQPGAAAEEDNVWKDD